MTDLQTVRTFFIVIMEVGIVHFLKLNNTSAELLRMLKMMTTVLVGRCTRLVVSQQGILLFSFLR